MSAESEDAIIYKITESQLKAVFASAHVCQQAEIVKTITERLAKGDVLLTEIRALIKAQDVKTETNDERTHTELVLIREQTTKTNGRVTKLESDSLKPRFGWPASVAAILAIITVSASAVEISRELIRSHDTKADKAQIGQLK